MGSVGDGEGNSKGGNLIVDVSDTETQAFDTQSPSSSSSSSGEKLKDVNADELHLFQSTVPFDDTIPLENSPIETQLVNHDGETQVVDYPDWVEVMTTQLLDVCEKELVIDSDDEGTDRTEVLTDVAEVSDDESEGGIGDNPVGLEKRQLSPPYNQGSLPRGSSDHAASLQASILAAHSLTPEETHTGPSSNLCSYQSGKEHDHPDHGISGIGYPAAIDTKVREVDRGHDTWKCNGNVKRHRDETECRVGNPTVRKLFNDVTLLGNGGSNSIIEGKNGGTGERDLPQLLARDHEFAGLSYVGSQEPGELSQANALDIVDRFLSVNNVELSQEVYPGTTMKGKSPPVMNARGPQSLVKKPNLRSPVGESAVFDWVDSREDEGGGDFFTKKKELLFERGGHGRRSLTQPQNSRNKIGKGLVDKFRQREEDLNLHQKIMGFSHSDSRLMLHNSKEVQIPETKTKKRLAKELDRQINEESPGKKLEAPAIGKDTPDVYDVGFDTQMAAEAMEALFCGNSADHEVDDAHQGPQNANENSPTGLIKKKSHSRHVSLCKKSCPDSGITTRQSKRAKILDAKLSKETINPSRKCCKNPRVKKVYPDSEVKTKVNGGKLKGEQPLDSWNAANGNESSRRRFSKFVKQRKTVGVMDRACVKDVGRCHSSSTSHGHLSYGKGQLEGDSRTFSPVAHRTRQCTAVNPMKRTDDSGKGKADLMAVGVHGSKRKRNSLGDAASKSLLHKGMDSKLSFNHVEVGKDKVSQEEQPGLGRPNGEIAATTSCAKRDALSYPRGRRTRRNISNNLNEVGNLDDAAFKSLLPHVEVGKDKVGQQEQPGLGRPNVEIAATTSSARRDALSYPRGRRTRRNISNNLNEVGNLDGPSTMIDGKEANEQFAAGGKRSQDKVSTTYVKLDMKRKTRSTIYPHPFLSSPERNSEENLARKNSVDSGSADAAVNCVSAVTSGKMLSKDLVGAKAAQHSDRKDYSTEGAEVNAKLEASPTEKVKTTCSACNTPINAASPVCLGNEYHKQSCRKSLLRSSLMKELIRLDASEALPTPALKDLRRRRDISNVRVLFSHHLDEDIVKQQKKILARLGVSIASSSADATHFVADKFVRTRNMLEAIALGKSVVTHLWLESCGQASCFIDEKNYILRDSKKEKEIGFSMPVSLAHASQHPLLQGKRVFVTPNVKPGKQLIAGLVKAVHGQAVERFGRSAMKDDKIPDDLLILSCEEDYLICMPLLEKGASVYSSELLLNGIVIQKLEYERHRLFMDHVKKTRSTIWLRKDGNQFLPVTKCK